MATHTQHDQKDTTHFITFTCYEWLSLIAMTNSYDAFDKWFDYLIAQHVSVLGYVIMPNHFHGLLHIPEECPKNLNQLVSNGKRFLAYEIVRRLESASQTKLLGQLRSAVCINEKQKNKKHHVFRPSFDAKECFKKKMLETKLDYIHFNPVRGKWHLVDDYTDYPYSSAKFYEMDTTHKYVKHFMDFV